ncbi:hypothetical protein HJC23_011165 [Cyclotella cryptica]|uniref:Sulfotransferase domain-containing protein n=1 Tax=Cyclotella cryptica TaxID=29204 RepID=A0ABD3P459_9STRA|eukprot:CCRYP_017641-RA/>CCRYP_017641-RA protein AED:0.04 eAED:0.04 QI:160/1/1/1/0.5/0.33/3/321/542
MAPQQQLSSRLHIVASPLPERPHHDSSVHQTSSSPFPRTKRRRGGHSLKILSTLICSVASGGVLASLAWLVRDDTEVNPAANGDLSRRVRSMDGDGRSGTVRSASVDTVVRFLMGLAEKRPAELWDIFGVGGEGYGDDPFSLSSLEAGQCPWSTSSSAATIDWLPPRPLHSDDLSAAFRSNMQSTPVNHPSRPKLNKRNRHISPDTNNDSPVILWYEHISKAGGTTFCALAQSNMPHLAVPRYHCMPRKGDLMDGRVGSWPNEELIDFLTQDQPSYGIVANEWDPFDLNKLKLSGRDLWKDHADERNTDKINNDNNVQSPRLLFVTTLRDPADRLLSSYTFFSDYSEEQQRDASNFGVWIKKNLARLGKFKVGGRSAFRSNIARNNYMVWRFSGGAMPRYHEYDEESSASFFAPSRVFSSSAAEKSVWERPFEMAVRALSLHDLVLPMDVMTQDPGKESLQRVLGWNQFALHGRRYVGEKESGHVVTTGEVRNSNAKAYLEERGSGEEFRALWERNWLDYVLFYWARAVFFARLYCRDVLAE